MSDQLEGWLTAIRLFSVTGFEIALVIAAFSGPIVAIRVERKLAIKREAKSRRIEIFRTLLGYRGDRLNPVYVHAFNIVPLEFHGSEFANVREKWVEHLDVLSEPVPPAGDEAANLALGRRAKETLHAMLREMAQVLGYSFSKRELDNDVYWPRAYSELEDEQRRVRRSIIRALDPRHGVPIRTPEQDSNQPLYGKSTSDTKVS